MPNRVLLDFGRTKLYKALGQLDGRIIKCTAGLVLPAKQTFLTLVLVLASLAHSRDTTKRHILDKKR